MSGNEGDKKLRDKEMEVVREVLSEDSQMKGGRQPYQDLQGEHFQQWEASAKVLRWQSA